MFQTGDASLAWVFNEDGAEQNHQLVDIHVRKKETFVGLGCWSLVVLCYQSITFYADRFQR